MINFKNENPKILVIGDLMIDHYLWGKCERISPEAPVQIVNIDKESSVLGGAGNVINNLRALGSRVDVLSVVGDDYVANELKDLLKIAINHKANMIYASSAATYGDSDRFEIGYEQPNNAYGFSKVMMDNITYEYLKQDLDISIVGLKYFNVYGPKEFYKNKTASMVVQFAHQILKGLTPKLFEGSDKILRDFIYIEDVIQANIKACNPKKSGVYNVGTGKARSFEDIVNILQKELEIDNGKEYIPNPYIGQYQFFTQANIQTTKENLNYEPKYSMEDGIIAYIPEIKRLFEQEIK